MEDTVLIAIVSSSGVLGGAVIGGCISYFISRTQNKARLEELSKQIIHQENESRRDRLIEDRKRYLPKLREAVSNWKVQLANMINKIESLGQDRLVFGKYPFSGYVDNKPDYKSYERSNSRFKRRE
ncbi:MAG: hypothetical protein ACYDG5_03745 [Dehalococcoidales bacterium]